MKKNDPIIAKVMMKATMLEPMKARVLNSANSTIGARERSSTATKAASAAAPPASSPTISGELQPQLLPSIRASTIAVRPSVSATTPG